MPKDITIQYDRTHTSARGLRLRRLLEIILIVLYIHMYPRGCRQQIVESKFNCYAAVLIGA